jgi:hypothetical protein
MKMNWVSTVTWLVTPFFIFFIYKLLGKTKTLKVPEKVEEHQVTEEQRRLYKQYMGWGGLVGILMCVAIAFLIYYFLIGMAKIYFSLMQPYDAIHTMPYLAIMIPAMFSALLTIIAISKYLSIKFYGQENYRAFTHLTNQQYGFDNEKLGRIMAKWGLIICILGYANILKTTSFLLHDKVKLMGFLSFQFKEYPIKEIKEIVVSTKQKAPNGNVIFRPRFYIVFNDGFKWDMDDEGDTKEFLRMMQFKTGVAVREVEFMDASN